MRTHSFFMRLLLSSVLLTMIPITVIYLFSSQEIIASSEKEIGRNCVSNLTTAENTIEQLKESIYKDCASLSMDSYVTNMNTYVNGSDALSVDEIINISQVLDALIKTVQTDSSYQSVYLYLDNFPYTITSNMDLVPNDSLTDTDWMSYYHNYKTESVPISFTNTHLLDVKNLGTSDSHVYVTTYIYPLSPYINPLEGAIVINLYESAVSKRINSGFGDNDGSVIIIDSGGTVVSDPDGKMLTHNIAKQTYISRILKSRRKSGYFSSKIGSTDYMISYYRSEINGWIYVGKAPLWSLMNSRNAVNRDTLLITLLLMAAGVSIAFLVTKKIYAPVDTMVRSIKSSKVTDLIESDDEMSVIWQALNAVEKGKGEKSEINRKKLWENVLIKLIGADVPDEESLKIFSEHFNADYFICTVVSIDEYNDSTDNYEEKRWKYIRTLLMEMAKEMVGQEFKCGGCTVKKGEIVLMCNVDGPACGICQAKLREIFDRYQTEVSRILDNTLTVGIGKAHSEIAGVRETYMEAETAMKQKLRYGLGRIIVWDDEWNNGSYYYPFEEEERIRNYLEMGMPKELTATVTRLNGELKSRQTLSCENLIQIVTQLAGNTIVKYMIEHHIHPAAVYGIQSDIYSEFARLETMDEIRNMLIQKYTTLIDYSFQMGNQKKTVDKIMGFIRENYCKNIGINDISGHLNLSYSHVRKIFRDETGTSIMEYINSLRIQEAKRLLLSKDCGIKKIALSVGYNNDQSFERYFKKIVGVTPGEFRSRKLQNLTDAGHPDKSGCSP